MTNGDLAVGGTFTAAGATAADNIAHWDGSTWHAFGSGLPADVTSIATFSTGELFATGLNQTTPAQWDGSTWNDLAGLSAQPGGLPSPWVSALAVAYDWNGEALYAAGNFRLGSFTRGMAVWYAWGGWQPGPASFDGLRNEAPTRMALAVAPVPPSTPIDSFAVAGPFDLAANRPCNGVAVITNSFYAPALTAGIDGVVITADSLANGDLLLGGRFGQVDRSFAPALAVGDVDGAGWATPTGGGVTGLQGSFAAPEVRSIVKMADGRHLIGGAFVVLDAAALPLGSDVVVFDAQGSAPFSNFGPSPFIGGVNAVLEHSDGTIFSGGNGVYRRDGSAWTQLSTVGNGLGVNCFTLAELPNGNVVVVVVGDLQMIPGPGRPGVMRWDGGAWQPIGAGLASVAPAGNLVVTASIVRDDGVLFVVGAAGTTSFAASFDGTWQLLPGPVSGSLHSLELLPNGDLVVGGEFDSIAGVAAASVARFDGSSWQAIGDGVRHLDGQPGTVLGLHFSVAGDLLITGDFSRHDGEISVNFTRVRSLCPSLSQSFAVGCVGSGGQNVLRGESGAWLGGTMRGVATGLASNGLAVNVLGLATAFAPLPGSSCTAWVRPDYLELLVPVAGQASTELAIPASPSLIGLVLHQQVVGVEIVGGSIAALTSSNRLQHTVGVF